MIVPMQDRILVKPDVRKLSEILIVRNTEAFNLGEVVAVGPGKFDKRGNRRPVETRVGDKVRYGNGSYLDWPLIEHEGEKYQLIQEADICFIEEGLKNEQH